MTSRTAFWWAIYGCIVAVLLLLLIEAYMTWSDPVTGLLQVDDVTIYQYGDTPVALVRGTLPPCVETQQPEVVQVGNTFTITIRTQLAHISEVRFNGMNFHVPYRMCRALSLLVGFKRTTPSVTLPKGLPRGMYFVTANGAHDTLHIR